MIKLISLIIAMALAFSVHAQYGITHQLEIKGGYLFDPDDQRASILGSLFGDDFRLDYQGIKYVAIGYTVAKDRTRFGIEIDYFKYGDLRPDINDVLVPVTPLGRNKRQIQFSLFYGSSIINTGNLDLYIAPIVSVAFRKNTLFDIQGQDLDFLVDDFVLGLGGKLQANFSLTDNLGVSLGSKLMVLDYFRRNEGSSIITTNNFEFIRGDAVVQVGLVFNI